MSDLDNAHEDYVLFNHFKEDEALSRAVVAVQTRAYQLGWKNAMEDRDTRDRQNRTLTPFLYMTVFIMAGAIGGAILWGWFARSGYIDIIGACTP